MKSLTTILALTTLTASALVIPHKRGEWPDSWPKELEPLREQASTTEWATGSQEDSHRIPFESREDFEKYWPVFSKLLKPGAVLRLHSPEKEASLVQDHTKANVVIQAPSASVAFDEENKRTFKTGYTWPKSAFLPNGTLPEYVEDKGGPKGPREYVPLLDINNPKGFRYRARIDIMLICDGKIIDLNRIQLPKGIAIEDNRLLKD